MVKMIDDNNVISIATIKFHCLYPLLSLPSDKNSNMHDPCGSLEMCLGSLAAENTIDERSSSCALKSISAFLPVTGFPQAAPSHCLTVAVVKSRSMPGRQRTPDGLDEPRCSLRSFFLFFLLHLGLYLHELFQPLLGPYPFCLTGVFLNKFISCKFW